MDNKTEYRDLNMTPREIVEELDRHIIGQKAAKRAVANALRSSSDETMTPIIRSPQSLEATKHTAASTSRKRVP
ncbi:MAG: hypothetical protein ACFNTM_05915 [Cardiobacterium sp.]